jgi:hypothetical protein
MYCFCGGVASFNVFCVLVTYPPGLGPPADPNEKHRSELGVECNEQHQSITTVLPPTPSTPRWYVRVKHKTPSHPFVHPSIPSAPSPLVAGTARAIGYTEQTV